jgi:hypothetical protein
MILYIFQNCTYFDKKKILREIYEDTQKLEQGVLRTPKIWDRVSLGNLARVSNLWPVEDWLSPQNLHGQVWHLARVR